jgi:hypothetical protein
MSAFAGIGFFSRAIRLGVALCGLGSSMAHANSSSPGAGVAVRVWVTSSTTNEEGDSAELTLSGTFLPSVPNGNDGVVSTFSRTEDAFGGIETTLSYSSTKKYIRVEPWKEYTVDVYSSNCAGAQLSVAAPPGYRAIIDGKARTTASLESLSTVKFSIEQIGAAHADLGGMVSSVAANEIELRISLGNLVNGQSAGDLAIVDSGPADQLGSAVHTGRAPLYAASRRPRGLREQRD